MLVVVRVVKQPTMLIQTKKPSHPPSSLLLSPRVLVPALVVALFLVQLDQQQALQSPLHLLPLLPTRLLPNNPQSAIAPLMRPEGALLARL